MLLKRQEKNGKIKAIYNSSTICASIYDIETRNLTVIFRYGGQYLYPNVDQTDYTLFETSESNGVYFNNFIKKKYSDFQKLPQLDDVATSNLLKEIETMNAEKEGKGNSVSEQTEKLSFNEKEFLIQINTILGDYIKNGILNKNMIISIKNNLSNYE
jgi:hypothetical protein